MDAETTQRVAGDAAPDAAGGESVVLRRSGQGWQVGPERYLKRGLAVSDDCLPQGGRERIDGAAFDTMPRDHPLATHRPAAK